ncbi:MAG: HD domain-containing protein [Candidatus Aenigmarchaeota archaeon]|nr:HD domain-containing protein [Candidatus Aenigmarchaeota archaeon]
MSDVREGVESAVDYVLRAVSDPGILRFLELIRRHDIKYGIDTYPHSVRTGVSVVLLGGDPDAVKSALVHDVGKIMLPRPELLKKPGDFTAEEKREVGRHTELGYLLLTGTGNGLPSVVAETARDHHTVVDQYRDQTESPRKRGGRKTRRREKNTIELLVGACERYDALRNARAYRGEQDADTVLHAMRSMNQSRVWLSLADSLYRLDNTARDVMISRGLYDPENLANPWGLEGTPKRL